MNNRRSLRLALGILPIVASLALTSVMILAVGSNPIEVFETVLQGAFRSSTSFATVINYWIPMTLCAIGLVVTFTAGLWNIGIEGQMAIGAVFASWAAQFVVLPSPLLIGLEIILAMLGGALWASLVGILKLRLGVHEIFGGVALNALANVISIYLVSGPWLPREGGGGHSTAPFPADALLPPISTEFPVSLLALVIVLVAGIIIGIALRGTKWGLNLKASGKNVRSALLLGVKTNRSALSALMVCGAVAGIAGSYRVLFIYGSLRTNDVTGGLGFLALLVVLLIGRRVIWAIVTSFIFSIVIGGSARLTVVLRLDPSLTGVLQGLVVLLSMFANGIRARIAPASPPQPKDMTHTVEIARPPSPSTEAQPR